MRSSRWPMSADFQDRGSIRNSTGGTSKRRFGKRGLAIVTSPTLAVAAASGRKVRRTRRGVSRHSVPMPTTCRQPSSGRPLRNWRPPARATPTAIMCAEALPWRCHRRLIADALVAWDWSVLDIFDVGKARQHELPRFAKVVERQGNIPGRDVVLTGPIHGCSGRGSAGLLAEPPTRGSRARPPAASEVYER